ncbi:MAG: REP element-mobilizing transposase RayT [Planctomycetota bacterium]
MPHAALIGDIDGGKTGTYWLAMRLIGMEAITLPAPELDLDSYTPPTPEMRALWKKRDAKFNTKSGHVPHQVRPTTQNSHGVLITWKLARGIGNLRTEAVRHLLEECFRKGKDRFGFKLISYSILSNHLHMIAIVQDDEALRKGTQGMGIRIGKAINKLFGRSGRVLRDRYHAKPMYGRAAIRRAITYVLQNARKHQIPIPDGEWDQYSSARFSSGLVDAPAEEWPVVPVCYFYAFARAALRTIRPDIFPGHLQLRA